MGSPIERSERRYANLTARRLIQVLILLGLAACGISGCFGPYGGGGYGYEGYPAYGYAPYSWGGVYAPEFVVHHPWEEHHDFGGHHQNYFHGPSGRPEGVGHPIESRGGGRR